MEIYTGDIALTIAMLSTAALGVWFVARRSSLRPLGVFVFGGTALCLGFILYIPGSLFFIPSDGVGYSAWGFDIAKSWSGENSGRANINWPDKSFFPLVIAVLFTLAGGPVYFSVVSLNAIALCASALAIQRAVTSLTGSRTAWAPVLLLASSPGVLLFGASMLRESIFWLGLSLGVLSVILARETSFGKGSAALAISIFFLLAIRPDLGSFLSACLLILWSWYLISSSTKKLLTRWVVSTLVTSATVALFVMSFSYFAPGKDAESVGETSASLAKPESVTAFPAETRPTSEATTLCTLSIHASVVCSGLQNLGRAVFGPFPNEIGKEPIWLVVSVSTAHLLVMVGFALYFSAHSNPARKVSLLLLGFSFLTILLFSSVLTNYGILFRFKVATEFLLLVPASGGLIHATRRLLPVIRRARPHLASQQTT